MYITRQFVIERLLRIEFWEASSQLLRTPPSVHYYLHLRPPGNNCPYAEIHVPLTESEFKHYQHMKPGSGVQLHMEIAPTIEPDQPEILNMDDFHHPR